MSTSSHDYIQFFRRSAPYIHAHRGRTFVIMLSGDALVDGPLADIVSDIALLKSLGMRIVLVHGARPQINQRVAQRNLSCQYSDHLRITDRDILECAKDAVGNLRYEIEALFSMGLANSPMHGSRIRVVSGNFVTAKPLGVVNGVDFQHTGQVRRIDRKAIAQHLDDGHIVLLSCIGSSPTGELFNLSAEEVATRTAIALSADKLILLSHLPGVLDTQAQLVRQMSPKTANDHLQQEQDPATRKLLNAAITAGTSGVRRSHIISYQTDGALLGELFTRDGTGTMVTEDNYEQCRDASIEDVGGILELIKPLEEAGVLVRRSRKQLEQEIHGFGLVERDGMIIGCATLNPFSDGRSAEIACVAIHSEYRHGNRGDLLMEHLEQRARRLGITRLFVLTTRTAHWFMERGFANANVSDLPAEKLEVYNLQRNSKVFIKQI